MQHGQIFELKSTGPDGQPQWAYAAERGRQHLGRGTACTMGPCLVPLLKSPRHPAGRPRILAPPDKPSPSSPQVPAGAARAVLGDASGCKDRHAVGRGGGDVQVLAVRAGGNSDGVLGRLAVLQAPQCRSPRRSQQCPASRTARRAPTRSAPTAAARSAPPRPASGLAHVHQSLLVSRRRAGSRRRRRREPTLADTAPRASSSTGPYIPSVSSIGRPPTCARGTRVTGRSRSCSRRPAGGPRGRARARRGGRGSRRGSPGRAPCRPRDRS